MFFVSLFKVGFKFSKELSYCKYSSVISPKRVINWKNWLLSKLHSLSCYIYIILTYLLKRGTTWNQLRPHETTWNQPEPPETIQKLPEITWNQPYYSIFLLKISYSQIEIVLILHPKVFFKQIWSQKLKFSKLT